MSSKIDWRRTTWNAWIALKETFSTARIATFKTERNPGIKAKEIRTRRKIKIVKTWRNETKWIKTEGR